MRTKVITSIIVGVLTLSLCGCGMGGGDLEMKSGEMTAEMWAKLEDGMELDAALELAPNFSERFDGTGTTTLVYDTEKVRYQVVFSQGELEMKDTREKNQ